MRIVSWNMNKATIKRIKSWEYISNLNPDLVLLQEVNSIPDFIENDFDVFYQKATNKNDLPQKFGTAILVKGKILNSIQLETESEWINKKLKHLSGNFVAVKVILRDGFQANVISVHSPAWEINPMGLEASELNKIKLENNSGLWGTELVWLAVKNFVSKHNQPLIVGGDFNSSPTFDFPKNRGNQEFLDRMSALELKECLFHSKARLIPTFRNAGNKKIIHQIDHLFVTASFIKNLRNCKAEEIDTIFGNSLSDHLPIIADFN